MTESWTPTPGLYYPTVDGRFLFVSMWFRGVYTCAIRADRRVFGNDEAFEGSIEEVRELLGR